MKTKSVVSCIIIALTIILLSLFIGADFLIAQTWQALPPYNVLWPLWSPALSPVDPVTGIPAPLVSSLDKNTFLPVEPALVWDPSLPYFYLLYNYIPSYGDPILKFFDPAEGAFSTYSALQTWPPSYMLTAVDTPTGPVVVPAPIGLPSNYATLFSFDPALWLNFWVPLANSLWQGYNGVNLNLLLASQLLNPAYSYLGQYY